MRKDYDYTTTMELKHHETAAIVDLNTGEVRTIKINAYHSR